MASSIARIERQLFGNFALHPSADVQSTSLCTCQNSIRLLAMLAKQNNALKTHLSQNCYGLGHTHTL